MDNIITNTLNTKLDSEKKHTRIKQLPQHIFNRIAEKNTYIFIYFCKN